MNFNLLNLVFPILGVIIGAIIGHLSSLRSVKLQNKLIEQKESKQLKKEKVEKIYRLAIEAKYQQRKLYTQALLYIVAQQDINIEKPDKDSLPLHELDLVVDLYIPDLKDDLLKLHLRSQVFNEFFIRLSNSRFGNLNKEEENKLHNSIKQSFNELESEFKSFMQKIAEYSQQI